MSKLFITFVILNVLNVIIQTIKSLLTIKGNKWVAAWSNAIAYGLYTVVLVYMTCELSLILKAVIVGGCNLIGVYIVKSIEERLKKEKLWKIECTVKNEFAEQLSNVLTNVSIPFTKINCTTNICLFNIYTKNQKESSAIREIIKKYDVKYFVTESKDL